MTKLFLQQNKLQCGNFSFEELCGEGCSVPYDTMSIVISVTTREIFKAAVRGWSLSVNAFARPLTPGYQQQTFNRNNYHCTHVLWGISTNQRKIFLVFRVSLSLDQSRLSLCKWKEKIWAAQFILFLFRTIYEQTHRFPPLQIHQDFVSCLQPDTAAHCWILSHTVTQRTGEIWKNHNSDCFQPNQRCKNSFCPQTLLRTEEINMEIGI